MKLNKKVQNQIESLTNNEDFRQDLWVAHFSGQQHLPTILQSIKEQHIKAEEFQYRLHKYAIDGSCSVPQLLDNFNNIERSILCMLILGYSIYDISVHYSTSQVRVQQSINNIQKHSVWSRLSILV